MAPADAIAAASTSPKLAKCSGKQRRPANPNGSILPRVDPVAGTSTPADPTPGQDRGRKGVDVFPEPVPPGAKPDQQVPPISSATPPTFYGSC
ncbi:hypothetical protein CDQ92_11400 [Sphingopyxis bauzanensis]|uniref:Uncharacterized protein n=2 Tax=Sphingopyxis bauzanensis TaxID=651663 RepID=A0A246JRG8_9SPHN|nr:hypothetical protein CDQ92_11400 [Sphingopyxis bauzanensis]